MANIQTSLTKLLDVKYPIVAAPMAGASGALAAQVSLAGGFGMLSAGYGSVEQLKAELKIAQDMFREPKDAVLSIGVGFLVWQLEKDPVKAEQFLSVTCEARPKAVWLSFGDDIGHWIDFVRTHDLNKGTADAIKIFVQVSTVKQVQAALSEWKADVIVAQGIEAGGHGLSTSLPLLTLLPLLGDAIQKGVPNGSNPPPLLAAGGIATGSQIASLLTLGASGVVLGTRFLLCPESFYTQSQRQALIEAESSKSVRTMAFDEARNTLGWPEDVDGRGLRNATVIDYETGVDIDTIRSRFAEGVKAEDSNRIVIWAGSSVGLMNKVQSAQDIVAELHEECLSALQKVRVWI